MAKFPEAQEFEMVQKGTELIELFHRYPDADTVLGLPESEKIGFVKTYYSNLHPSEEIIERLRSEGENYFGTQNMPQGVAAEQLKAVKVIGLIYITKANLMPQLIDICDKHNRNRREQLKGLDYTDSAVPKILQQSMVSLQQEISQIMLQEVKNTANKRGFPVVEVEKYGAALIAKDPKLYEEIYNVYCAQRAEHLQAGGAEVVSNLKQFLQTSIQLNQKVWQPDTDPKAIFFYPQLVADELLVLTGLEKPVVMQLCLHLVEKEPADPELVELIVREAFVLEGTSK